jgi:predicted solute-binding protein
VEVVTGVPALINGMLAREQIDVAPCSSLCLLSHTDNKLAIPMGVVSKGAVQSVYLGFNEDHKELWEKICIRLDELRSVFALVQKERAGHSELMAEIFWYQALQMVPVESHLIPSLKLSAASETSAMLTKILYRLWFGEEPYRREMLRLQSNAFNGSKQLPLELLIGDEALRQRSRFFRILDLGDVWHRLTGLPFVFALWQSKGPCQQSDISQLIKVAETAEAKMRSQPEIYWSSEFPTDHEGVPVDLYDYWRHIYYRVGAEEMKGLSFYLSLARELLPHSSEDFLARKIYPWQRQVDPSVTSTL